MEQARRHGDYAQAGVAAVVTLDVDGVCQDVRLVYLNAGDKPMVARQAAAQMLGEKPTEDLLEEAAHIASQQEIDPTADIHDSAEFKRHLAFVLGKRTLERAVSRARADISQ
jgi:carbon-monoxide dehydrogenase medium subunit